MAFTTTGWHVRIVDKSDLFELGKRIENALQLSFTPTVHIDFDCDSILEANFLGLWITLSEDTTKTFEDGSRRYQFHAEMQDDIYNRYIITEDDSYMGEYTDISNHIVDLLRLLDSPDWYIPDLEE